MHILKREFHQLLKSKKTTVEHALEKYIHSNNRIFIQTGCGSPQYIVKNLAKVMKSLDRRDIEVVSLHVNGETPHLLPEYDKNFNVSSMFFGPNERKAIEMGRKDIHYIPVFLSDTPRLFKKKMFKLDTVLVQVSPPDVHGFCSMGPSVDCSLAALKNAKHVIAQINSQVPRTLGDGFVHVSEFSAVIEHDEPLFELKQPELDDELREIGKNVASLIRNGACVQLGVGAVPNAVCEALSHHKNLGVHTEMFSDGVVELFNKGAITNKFKEINQGKIVTSFVMGSKRVYDFVNDNPQVQFFEADYVNDISTIRQHSNMIAINSALEIDLTGQINADSIGPKIYSGVGGQLDFMLGAKRSLNGRAISAMKSCVKKDGKIISKIVPQLKPGSGVVTTRSHAHYVVTEFGIVNLFGKNIRERALDLISISHPSVRDELRAAAEKQIGPLDVTWSSYSKKLGLEDN